MLGACVAKPKAYHLSLPCLSVWKLLFHDLPPASFLLLLLLSHPEVTSTPASNAHVPAHQGGFDAQPLLISGAKYVSIILPIGSQVKPDPRSPGEMEETQA
ncbi:unnamed protein product [Arctogadus glacialis]